MFLRSVKTTGTAIVRYRKPLTVSFGGSYLLYLSNTMLDRTVLPANVSIPTSKQSNQKNNSPPNQDKKTDKPSKEDKKGPNNNEKK